MQHFLLSHPGEVLLLDFQHLYNFTSSQHDRLVNLLRKVLGPLLCPPQPTDKLNLSYLSRNQYQVNLYRTHWQHHLLLCQVILLYRGEDWTAGKLYDQPYVARSGHSNHVCFYSITLLAQRVRVTWLMPEWKQQQGQVWGEWRVHIKLRQFLLLSYFGMLARIKKFYTVIIRMCCIRLCAYF